MDFNFNKMTACDEPFYGVVLGKAAYPIGCVCLPVTFGTQENFRTEYLTFEAADFRSSYHAILSRPMLAKFMSAPHHTYLIMKMSAPNEILSVLGDIMVSYNFESSVVACIISYALVRKSFSYIHCSPWNDIYVLVSLFDKLWLVWLST
jgi:hypothetical protein